MAMADVEMQMGWQKLLAHLTGSVEQDCSSQRQRVYGQQENLG
jgi:hypothetical protein